MPEWEAIHNRARWQQEEAGYSHIQSTKPQTLSYGLNDSPTGLAAWIVEKFRTWSDCNGRRRKRIYQGRPSHQRHHLLGDPDHQLLDPPLL